MKVAIIHDVFVERGGAERVFLSMLQLYPDADVFIPLMKKEERGYIASLTTGKVQSSFFNDIPFIHSASILLKPFLFWYWESLQLQAYDLVITSSHSFSSKAVLTSPFTLHLSYIHTPPRYLYTEYNETRILQHPWLRYLFIPLLSWMRSKDYLAAQRPDLLVANSLVVQKRIQKYYRRDSIIISPPVSIPKKINKKKGKYFVCFSRLAKQKGLDVIVQTCTEKNLPLLVVGTGSQRAYLESLAGPTVQFLGYVQDTEVAEIYSNAMALLYCSIEEDFGIVPVEAMAHGVPVIGYKSGGTAETVIDGKTGILFDDLTVNGLFSAITRFHTHKFTVNACINQAEKYSESIFQKKISKVVESYL